MTPQKKAEQLVQTYKDIFWHERLNYLSKEFAIICINEIINYSKTFEEIRNIDGDDYWLDVKSEIQKL